MRTGAYGSTKRYKSVQRIFEVNKSCIVGAAGELSDFQAIQQMLEDLNMEAAIADDGIQYTPKEVHAYLCRVLYNRRNKCAPSSPHNSAEKVDPDWRKQVSGRIVSAKHAEYIPYLYLRDACNRGILVTAAVFVAAETDATAKALVHARTVSASALGISTANKFGTLQCTDRQPACIGKSRCQGRLRQIQPCIGSGTSKNKKLHAHHYLLHVTVFPVPALEGQKRLGCNAYHYLAYHYHLGGGILCQHPIRCALEV